MAREVVSGFSRIKSELSITHANFRVETMKRIQRKRIKGWRMPGKWGNPYGKNTGHTVHESIQLFREYLNNNPELVAEAKETLAGHDLACWCPLNQSCHADIWLEILQEESRNVD